MAAFENYKVAETAALERGDGTFLIDTAAQAYYPMLQEVRDGSLVYAGYGGWDTGRFGLDRDLIEGIKKGHVAIAHAFLAKGADPKARDRQGGPALHWAAGSGRAETVRLLIEHGADVTARDHNDMTALQVAVKRGHEAVAALLRGTDTSSGTEAG
jgi:hypothetical protein